MSNERVRLSKRMSELGICSRREADKLIEKGLVSVNGELITQLGTKVLATDKIQVTDQGQQILDDKITVILNKPVGFVSSQPEKDYVSAMKLLNHSNRLMLNDNESHKLDLKNLAPAGRLDIDSKGLIIYTQDGVIAKKIIGENSNIDKEYIVQFKGQLTDSKINQLTFGQSLDGRKLKKAKVIKVNEYTINITLKEGRKRQIRRMLDLVGLKVTHLKRVRIGPILLEKLKAKQWRVLSSTEIKEIINY